MGWVIGVILMGVVLIGALVAAWASGPVEGQPQQGFNVVRAWGVGIAGLMVIGIIGITIASSLYIVDAGHVGVVKTFGSLNSKVASDGPAWVAPWSDLTEVSTKAQRKEFDHLAAFSKETQDVFVDATLNLAVAPHDVPCLYRTVGANWYDTLIPSRVLQTLKDETVKYTTVAVAPHREQIRKSVRDRLQAQLTDFRVRPGACKFTVDVQDFLLRNIDFRPEFKQAIEDKQIATQDAQTAQNRVAQRTAEAQQQVAEANGEAQSTLVRARAQATANRLLSNSLTDRLVQYQYVTKLAPNVKAIVPSNGSILVPTEGLGK